MTVMLLTGIRNAHIYGIDLADTKELVAFNRTEDDVAKHIGADAADDRGAVFAAVADAADDRGA